MKFFEKRTKLDRRFITVSFSVDRKHISADLLQGLIVSLQPWFDPIYSSVSGELKPFDRGSFENEFKGFIHAQDKEQSMGFIYPYHLSSPFIIEFDIYSENFGKLLSVFDLLLNLDGFYVAYAFNKEDNFIQNNSNLFFYKERKIPLTKDMLIKDRFGDVRVDIKRNPGRRVLIDKMWMMSSWQMWFGQNSYDIFSKERLLSFSGTERIADMGNYIHVQLYENHYDADRKESRKIQQSFREWMSMDEIEEKCNQKYLPKA